MIDKRTMALHQLLPPWTEMRVREGGRCEGAGTTVEVGDSEGTQQ